MNKFFDENALAIIGLVVIACWAMRVNVDPGSQNIVSAAVGGLLGYLAKTAKTA